MKEYWLSLFPDTFLWIRQEKGYIYNSINGRGVRFENVGTIAGLTAVLEDIDALYRVKIGEKELNIPEVKKWVKELVDTGCGRLAPDDGRHKCPVSMRPELRIQDDIEYYQWEYRQHIDGNIIHNLHELVFYVNGSRYGDASVYRQIRYPLPEEVGEANVEQMEAIVASGLRSELLSTISLVGNIWNYSAYTRLLSYLKSTGKYIILYVVDKDAEMNAEELEKWKGENICFHIWVTEEEVSQRLFNRWKESEYVVFDFKVGSEQEYEQAEIYRENYGLRNTEVLPVYTGDNFSFFRDHLFLTPEEIEEFVISKREIFLRQTLNIYHFGKLYVLPEGDVYANLNDPQLGRVEEPLHDIVYREMTEGKSWFRIRDGKTCRECLYQWLCPSPSNYELVMGKSCFCHTEE